MSDTGNSTVFLERRSYRQRRLRDAARMLPVFGVILWILPLLWAESGPDTVSNALAFRYVFGSWVVLIILTAIVTRLIQPERDPNADEA